MVRIDGTSFGSITVDGEVYHHDIWIFADGSIKRRDRNHEFTLDELYGLLEGKPELIIVGTGQSGCVSVEEAVLAEAKKRGFEVVDEITPKAIRRYNDALRAGKKVAGAFHTTC
jgi:hypothetical protein